MPKLSIRLFGDPVLRQRAAEVSVFDDALRQLATDMLATMHEAAGAGLAATQVGILKRLFTWSVPSEDGDGRRDGAWVNPRILETSEDVQDGDEGCLSFPGLFYPTVRPLRVRMAAQDVHGEEHTVEGEGLLARILLHEIDHLNGILFIDHLAKHDRRDAMRRIRAGELEHPPPRDGDGPAA